MMSQIRCSRTCIFDAFIFHMVCPSKTQIFFVIQSTKDTWIWGEGSPKLSHQQKERERMHFFFLPRNEKESLHAVRKSFCFSWSTHNEISAQLVSACFLPSRRAPQSLTLGNQSVAFKATGFSVPTTITLFFSQLKDEMLGKVGQRSPESGSEEAISKNEIISCSELCLPLCDPMDWSTPTPLSMDLPGKNTGEGRHTLLQEIFLTQRSSPGPWLCKQTLYSLSHQGTFTFLNLAPKWDPAFLRGYSAVHVWHMFWPEEENTVNNDLK